MPPVAPDVDALHFGSLSLIRLPAANAFTEQMRREAGRRIISFDPNIRASLVDDEPDYRARLNEIFHLADVIKLSGVDLAWIAPGEGHRRACRTNGWRRRRVSCCSPAAERVRRSSRAAAPSPGRQFRVKVADTVGAGDAINGWFARSAQRPPGTVARAAGDIFGEARGWQKYSTLRSPSLLSRAAVSARIRRPPGAQERPAVLKSWRAPGRRPRGLLQLRSDLIEFGG